MSELIKKPVQFAETGVKLSNIEEAYRFAGSVVASGLAGQKAKTDAELKQATAEVMIKMQTGMELGFPPMMSFKHIHVINGVPSLSVESCAALVEKNGGLEPGTKFRAVFDGEERTDDWSCTIYSTPKGGKEIASEPVYWKQFKHLHSVKNKWGNLKDNWQNFPQRMMRWRAMGYHIKDNYAAYLFGVHVAEDAQDYAPKHTEARLVNPGKQHDPLLDFIEPEPTAPEATVVDADEPDPEEAPASEPEPELNDAGELDPEQQEWLAELDSAENK